MNDIYTSKYLNKKNKDNSNNNNENNVSEGE